MKKNIKQNLSLLSFSILATIAHAALVEKPDLIEMAEGAMTEQMCSKEAMQCLAIPEVSICKESVKESLAACSETVPESVNDMDEVRDVSSALSSCALKIFMDKHKENLIKNATNKSCQKIIGK